MERIFMTKKRALDYAVAIFNSRVATQRDKRIEVVELSDRSKHFTLYPDDCGLDGFYHIPCEGFGFTKKWLRQEGHLI
jgi:hypothetical protein